jgi:hypothetical protein
MADRAEIVARCIRQLLAEGMRQRVNTDAWPPGLFEHLECFLRDEFADERQQAISEIRDSDT